ncbi:MAG: DUF5702 domain-containing protein [Clostridiales bacterium]|nr:DUF5702 domain-containing protein [Clostridiales bacterium]
MKRVYKNEKGVITVFVSLLLVSVLSFGTLMIESGRMHSAKAQLGEVGISAATSVLSNYDLNLYQRYGILAYNLDDDTRARFQDHIYFDSDLDADYLGNNVSSLYGIKDTTVTGFYNLTYPSVLKRQIMSKSKYLRSSYAFALNFNNASNLIADFRSKVSRVKNVVSDAIGKTAEAAYVSALANLEAAYVDLRIYDEADQAKLSAGIKNALPTSTGTIKDNIPSDEAEAIQATLDDAKSVVPQYASSIGTISATNDDTESTAEVRIDASSVRANMKSARVNGQGGLAQTAYNTLNAMTNTLGQLCADGEQSKNLLLNSYLAKHCPNRTYIPDGFTGATDAKATDNFVKCYAEYIFGGSAEEIANQESAYWEIFYFRFCDNMNCLIQKYPDIGNSATKVLWAYYESLVDMTLLTDYCTETFVPLTKTRLFLPINNLAAFSNFSRVSDVYDVLKNRFGSVNCTIERKINEVTKTGYSCEGTDYADYTDYVSIALWFVSNADKLTRLSDLIQLEMRYKQSHLYGESVTFRSRDCYTYCKVEINARFRTVLPVISVDSHGDAFSKASLKSIKYVGF